MSALFYLRQNEQNGSKAVGWLKERRVKGGGADAVMASDIGGGLDPLPRAEKPTWIDIGRIVRV